MIYLISVINDDGISTSIMAAIVTTMVAVIMIRTIYANCYNCCKCEIGWIVSIIIGWYIRYISRRIHILYDWCLLDNYSS